MKFTFSFEPTIKEVAELTPISPICTTGKAGVPDRAIEDFVPVLVQDEAGNYVYYDAVAAHKASQAINVCKSAKIPVYGQNGAYATIDADNSFEIEATDAAEVAFYNAVAKSLKDSLFIKAVVADDAAIEGEDATV